MTVTDCSKEDAGVDVKGPLPELKTPQLIPTTLEKLEDYSNNLKRLSIHQLSSNLRAFGAPRETDNLYRIHPTQQPFILQFDRDPQTGKVLSYKEVETSGFGETSKNSLSLTRAHGPVKESVKGNSTNLPFWPGGFEEEKLLHSKFVSFTDGELDESEINESLFKGDLLQSPPGLPTVRLEFSESGVAENVASLSSDTLQEEAASIEFWETRSKKQNEVPETESQVKVAKKESGVRRFLREIPDDIFSPPEQDGNEEAPVPVLRISKTTTNLAATALPWAEAIDVTKPMTDFHEKVPDMAFKYPFQLDTFQQQAIAKLEEHENVFVAAHTSAGKTVVAEYAIALSVRHMTRTVYTSPIKALSNQKFRDFKNNFESVGLITGDVQINSTASCLIMTTEILRSMLYNGSDVIRDLEWVIFDEIHYLNNEERGHVWEEVLIMLPQHVSIIMLSATVPNALHFANWVGEIKKKKIYVISTPKRPVPLEHHLYTGCGGKSRNEQFLILDGSGDFKKRGYEEAREAKNSRMSKHQQTYGPKGNKGGGGFNENTEKTLYVGLVSHLKENDKLPVVVFTFSRNKCDTYAKLLSSVDLCTGAQKAEIHGFFQKSISRLKGTDKELPQVLTVKEMLKNGVGIHHSGILPILKEVVEMLFQRGLVKLLFATETFAMGVNMPARTVVFDSTRKHDGTQFRNLNPAEYIQMAGRAGRRGLDTTGTVIILCKNNVPDIMELREMMLGKAAKLESQFRLTYSMILNLLRVESLSVEDVMKRSFLEAGTRSLKMDDIKEKLNRVKEKLEELDFEPRIQELTEFYTRVKDFLQLHDTMMEKLVNQTKLIKELYPGRFVIFEQLPKYSPRLGIILSSSIPNNTKKPRTFEVLTLISDMDEAKAEDKQLKVTNMPNIDLLEGHKTPAVLDRKFRLFLYFAHPELLEFFPDSIESHPYLKHTILTVQAENVLEIINYSVKLDQNSVTRIKDDVGRRALPRFRDAVPGTTTMQAVNDLYAATTEILARQYFPELFRPISERLQIKNFDLDEQNSVRELDVRRGLLKETNYFQQYENFLDQFRETFFYMRLVDEKNHLEYLLSPKSLRLHEEYQARILVLQELGYIDNENLVQMKGRVACEMGNQNELMMTEIIFNNILSDCPPTEVAALLSCMVFEAKNVPEPKLSPDSRLKQKVDAIKALARYIGEVQRDCGVSSSVDAFVEQFKFGLVEVVYEWAQGKPFADIMTLTEVQEGLIVRTIQRLDEMIKDVKDAARIIGDPTTKKKMEEASECIKRDIVFAASLYTQ